MNKIYLRHAYAYSLATRKHRVSRAIHVSKIASFVAIRQIFTSPMSERNTGMPTRESDDSPQLNTGASQDKTLITPPPSQSPAFQAEGQPRKRRRRKGNNWTRKKLPSRTTTQHSDLLSAPATNSKEEDHDNDGVSMAIKSEGVGDLTAGK